MFFTKLILLRSYFNVNDVCCYRGDGYFNLEEVLSDYNLDYIKEARLSVYKN